MILAYSNSYLKVFVDKGRCCLVQSWKGYCTSDEFRIGQQKTLDLFLEYKCEHFITDTTNATPLDEMELVWVTENITPKLRAAGMKVLNVVLPSSEYTRVTLQILEKEDRARLNTEFRFFGSLDSALGSLN